MTRKPLRLIKERDIQRTVTDAVRPGARFGRLFVLRKSSHTDGKNTFWDCRCDCGGTARVSTYRLRSGHTSSCKCWQADNRRLIAASRINPFKRERRIWYGMLKRCSSPHDPNYKWYGGRGISVCKEWHSFERFLSDMGPSEGLQLDRINNEEGYSPDNCRWTTSKENNNNKRSNRLLHWNGRTQSMSKWAEEIGISKSKLRWTIEKGHSLAYAIETYTGA